jgi:hypothetical protein
MQSFLETAAQTIYSNHSKNDLQHIQVILPSRRAVFFFKKALSDLSELPFFAPRIESIDDFILRVSGLSTLDNVDLYFEIYDILSKIDSGQSFEKFMSWVPTLLKDFENIDFSLVADPHLLFKYMSEADAISRWELSEDYVFTTTAQSYFSFFDKISMVYEQLNQKLLDNKTCYRGMVYRKVAENPSLILSQESKKYYFVGLNALSRAEEKIIETLEKAKKSECIWDTDDFYMNSQNKAGKKLRIYKKSGKFGKWSFQNSYLKDSEKDVRIFELNNDSLQSKLVSNLALESANKKHVIVVLDENQFLPLLLNIPSLGLPFNISIGLPISNSQFAEILRMIIACFQYHEHNDTVKNHQATFIKIIENPVLNILITNEIGEEQLRNISKSISKSKRLFFDNDWLAQNKVSSEIIDVFFKKGTVIDCISAIELVINRFFEVQIKDFGDLEFVFANVLKSKINLIKEKIKAGVELNFKSFRSLTEDLLKNQRVPFEGESDTPLQIMSMLETRCIDFECVTIMTFNEGNLPSAKKINSFFPFDASKIFGLPLYSDQDAIMAYHFFRLLQRAKTLNFIYLNGSSEALGNKEKSRFIRQVEEELTVYNPKVKIKYPLLHFQNTENKAFKNGISVEKDNISRIQDFLSSKGLSATSINDYLSCSLKFYWKYIEKIRNEDELKSQIGTDVFGTIVHKVLENLDEPFLNAKTEIGVKELKVQKENIQKELALAIKESHKQFDFDNGMNLILLSVVEKILEKYFLKREKELAENFRVIGIEKELFTIYSSNGTNVRLKGIIDKIESTSSFLRVIDYKTGKVEEKDLVVSKEENLAEILMNPKKTKLRQLVIYYYLINSNLESLEADLGEKIDMSRIRLLIYSFRNLTANLGFDTSNFSHTEIVEAVSGMLEKISQGLLDSEQLFEQTEDKAQCKYCDFIQVCQRG